MKFRENCEQLPVRIYIKMFFFCTAKYQNFHVLLGDLGKELKNLITMMDQDDDPAISSTLRRTNNKESPV